MYKKRRRYAIAPVLFFNYFNYSRFPLDKKNGPPHAAMIAQVRYVEYAKKRKAGGKKFPPARLLNQDLNLGPPD